MSSYVDKQVSHLKFQNSVMIQVTVWNELLNKTYPQHLWKPMVSLLDRAKTIILGGTLFSMAKHTVDFVNLYINL